MTHYERCFNLNKQQFAIIGHPIGHTMSPFINNRLFELSKINADYEAFDVSLYDLPVVFPSLCKLNGYNVTIPHKYPIVSYMDFLSKRSQKYRSVNTVSNSHGKVCGYTTDLDGFLKSLNHNNIKLEGRVVIVGAGGVSRILAYESVLAGCPTVIAVRPKNLNMASYLAGDIRSNTIYPQIETCLIDNIEGHIDLLINATPCGMHPKTDEMPVCEDVIKNCTTVFDAVYNPSETCLLKTAKRHGATTIGGLPMLVWQAVASHKIWTDSEFSTDDINQLIEDAEKEMKKVFSTG